MTHLRSWEDLANEFRQIKHPREPLRADWLANEGSENYGIWLLRPEGSDYYEAREAFCLLAARATEKLGLAPIPTPTPLQHDPSVPEQIGSLGGNPAEEDDLVPYGLGEDAPDPCTRAWLEELRLESKAVRSTGGATLPLNGHDYNSFRRTIPGVCGASATHCTRLAREEIQGRLEKRLAQTSGAFGSAERPPSPSRDARPRKSSANRAALRQAGDGTMGKAESWNISRVEFRNLAAAYPDFPSVRGRLSDGTYIWRPVGPSKAAEEDFNVAATRAALIGGLPPGVDPIFNWHELLSRSGAASQTGTDDIGANQDGRVHPTLRSWNIEIPRVLAASAAYCAVQERFAIEAAAPPGRIDEA